MTAFPPAGFPLAGFVANALGPGPTPELIAAITGNGLRPEQRLSIHRNATRIGLSEALAAHYPAIQRLVGEEFFAALAGRFIEAHPPRTPVLAEWGGELGDFLADFPPAAGLPYLPDVARLEWAINEVLHEADATPLDTDTLGGTLGNLAPGVLPRVRLAVHPAHRTLASPWPVARIVAANRGEGWAERWIEDDSATISLDEGPDHLLILRPEMDVAVLPVGAPGLALIQALAAGMPLGAALAEASPDNADPARLLGRLLGSRVIVGVSL
ncbi:DNA-binding domain-containing protein [Roseospirillum parvum]|uniref:Putative DNA-binding domain-containing protein n=1 Tax=Roseospirillum parvum TaxID=83401 RepID=A0A1G8DFR9_9PROT|nr:putative DNA-binding domain-containing protein [Roseospirillum parvum]SDH56522.1 hypothetical protein SAMN05421742_1086 [Roseospirillum parvum]